MWIKIKVLLWKSLQLRKRHWCGTIIEIIMPCLLFLFLYYLKSLKGNDEPKNIIVNETIPVPVSEYDLYNDFKAQHSLGYYIYTPKTPETEQIMKIVANKLQIASGNIDTANDEGEMIDKFNIKYNTSDEYTQWNSGFGIVFKEIKRNRIFKYKLRSTSDVWKTELLFPTNEILGLSDSGQMYFIKGFLALQLILDKTFISLDNNANITDYNLKLQAQPYSKYIKDLQFDQLFEQFLPLFTVLSFLLMCAQTIKRVVEEKDSGIKELMKMMGLKSWMIWTGWILHNFFTYAISITVITYISCFEIFSEKGRLLNYTDPFLFWIFLAMYMVAGIFFCFAISSVFKRPLIALLIGIISWIISFNIPLIFLKPTTSILLKTLFMLLPNVGVINVFATISSLESLGVGLQFSTLFTIGKGDNSFSVGFVLFMFIVDCFLYGFVAWYLDSVMPGNFGVAKPLNFLCKWSKSKTKNNDLTPISKIDIKLFEKPPSGYDVGISIRNLYKRFGNCNAVNGVNLELYKGQITALLGHNGAGKTTTMSIITGLFSPSFGTIEIDGNDLFSNIDRFRTNLGLCPQHNLLFSYLTTLDHLIFFGMLKGMAMNKAKSEGLNLLKLLNILDKKDELVGKLSGGMKRKLSLAIALVGSPEILILDEPTSGMDPESRREMWDLLLSFRGTRTILITTHFMEEADVLGDRIAIMNHGQVICYGTSLFLKKAYGTGYNLTIVKKKSCNESKIITEIQNIISEVKVKNSTTAQLVINLPNENIDQFSDVFKMLETHKSEFDIKGLGISYTTMDEVFLKTEKNVPTDDIDEDFAQNTNVAFVSQYISGISLLKNQLKVLLEKKVIYTCRRWLMSLIFGFGSIILGALLMKMIDYSFYSNSGISQGLYISLSTYKDSIVYYHTRNKSSEDLELNFVSISKENHASVFEVPSQNNIIDDLLDICDKNLFKYKTNIMIAGDFNQTDSTVIYNSIAIHTSTIAVNMYTNALLRKLSGNDKSYISTINEPIILNKIENVCNPNFARELTTFWHALFTPSLLFLIGYFIALPLAERVSGIKHLQMMTKLSPTTYWAACFLWDFFCYVVVVTLTLIVMYLLDTYHIFTGPNELYVLFVIMLIYGWTSIFYAYVYSFFKNTLISSMLLFISINFIIGSYINNVMFILKDNIKYQNKINPFNFLNIIRYILLIIPHFSYSSCIEGFIDIAWENNKYKVCKSPAENIYGTTDYIRKSYFVFQSDENKFGILEETLFLFFSSVLYIAIILLFDYKLFSRLNQLLFNVIVGTGGECNVDDEDPDVDEEKNKVNVAKTLHSSNESSPLLLVDNLVKKFSYKFTGVRGISFAVSPGECFGLLGVNGAGKTTTFRILTGETFPSQGNASIYTDKIYRLSSDIRQYGSMIGYCPQFNAINDQLTGRETLKLMAILRGISPLNTEEHIDKWIQLMGLNEYKDRLSGNYSGGNKRKLNTAMALIGDPPVVFLDEPTSGVDPVARRNIWKLLATSQRDGQAIVLTSHSMDECEALCNRLTIMVDGVMKCVGNIQYLKNRYGQGFTVKVKLLNNEEANVSELKLTIERQFSPDILLKDEHKGLLHYHITNSGVPLFEIFGKMKTIKTNYSMVEDYTVSDTTLEQVFIAFAKRQAVLKTNK